MFSRRRHGDGLSNLVVKKKQCVAHTKRNLRHMSNVLIPYGRRGLSGHLIGENYITYKNCYSTYAYAYIRLDQSVVLHADNIAPLPKDLPLSF